MDFYQQLCTIKLLALDVDGVLTNGEIIYTDDGRELKIFNVKDGHGISMLRASGMEVALITGRNSIITERRAEELKIRYVFQGIKKKLVILEQLMEELGLKYSEVAYMGDDTPDIPVLNIAGFAACPADAIDEVKRICHYTTKAAGGRGAVREVCDMLLASKQLSSQEQAVIDTQASPG
jgi:3-deoxy-D-manno-octulosonate 8-phosphate phosphatase (KDO 8-P phosphatase)